MQKEKKIRTYQRRTKSGKMMTVRAHTAKYEAADKAKEAAKKKGAGEELEKRKGVEKEMPNPKLSMKEYLEELKKKRQEGKEEETPKETKEKTPRRRVTSLSFEQRVQQAAKEAGYMIKPKGNGKYMIKMGNGKWRTTTAENIISSSAEAIMTPSLKDEKYAIKGYNREAALTTTDKQDAKLKEMNKRIRELNKHMKEHPRARLAKAELEKLQKSRERLKKKMAGTFDKDTTKVEKKSTEKKTIRPIGSGTNGPTPKKKSEPKTSKSSSEPAFTAAEFKEWYRGTGSDADKKVAKALRKQLGRAGYNKFENEAIEGYSSRGHLSMFKRVSGVNATKSSSKETAKSTKTALKDSPRGTATTHDIEIKKTPAKEAKNGEHADSSTTRRAVASAIKKASSKYEDYVPGKRTKKKSTKGKNR